MAFKIQKAEAKPTKEIRLSMPGDLWELVEGTALAEGVEAHEVIRQAIAYALRPRKARKSTKD